MKTKLALITIFSLISTLAFGPMCLLAGIALFLLANTSIWFGIFFFSATTLLVLKSLPIAVAVFVVASFLAKFFAVSLLKSFQPKEPS